MSADRWDVGWRQGYRLGRQHGHEQAFTGIVIAAITGAIVGGILTAAVLTFTAPRSAATAIPAGDLAGQPIADRKESRSPSGNLSLPSEAPSAANDRGREPSLSASPLPGGASSSPSPAAVLSPPATPKPKAVQLSDGGSIAGGIATWCAPTPTQCRRWGGRALLGAVPSFRWGDKPYRVRVRYRGHRVDVTVVSFCACPGDRIIDLSPWAFRKLAPTWRGTIQVSVQDLR